MSTKTIHKTQAPRDLEPSPRDLEPSLEWVSLQKERGASPGQLLDGSCSPEEVGDVIELTESIRELGVLTPVLLRRSPLGLEVVHGRRRIAAAREAGLLRVPALIVSMDPESLILALEATAGPGGQRPRPSPLAPTRRGLGIQHEAGESQAPPEPPRSPEAAPSGRMGRNASVEAPAESARPGETTRPGDRPGASRAIPRKPARAPEELSRLLGRSKALLEEVRSTRGVQPSRAELLAESIRERARRGGLLQELRSLAGREEDQLAAHTVLVTALAARAAPRLAREGVETETFLLGALLHDIGMPFLPQDLLSRPESLSPHTREELARHTRIGHALIAANGEWSEAVARVALEHHERWNGSGYPAGKVGDETSLPARALGLLDAYGALLMPRPHRDALSPEAAQERIARSMELGLFDPSLAPLLTDGSLGLDDDLPSDPELPSDPILPSDPLLSVDPER